MRRILLAAILIKAIFVSCASGSKVQPLTPLEKPEVTQAPVPYFITDYKNRSNGGRVPIWINSFYESGVSGIEALDEYKNRFIFISRNEGKNFKALEHWEEGFSAKLDFPRLAAARIEERFVNNVLFPDETYGSFYEAMVRATSDASWSGAAVEDSFWLRRRFMATQNENGEIVTREEEKWEFIILVSMEKVLFNSQLDTLFRNIKPSPRPSRDQNAAANRVKDRFYEGF